MKKSGHADLPLHYGKVPPWLYNRMSRLGGAILEAIILDYGKQEVLRRISDPYWFQALGCVLGMDWHSSGITTSVLGALKKSINPKASELGIYFCGGRGKHSLNTPNEILQIANRHGLPGDNLVKSSRLSAKIDNTAIQDGFQIYLHCFIVTDDGKWTVVQQGMNTVSRLARRYHWRSEDLRAFVEEPHSAIIGKNVGSILNLTDKRASSARTNMLDLIHQPTDIIVKEAKRLIMPGHHDVRSKDVNIKKLGSILAMAKDSDAADFENLLLTHGIGPRSIQSLALISEVVYGSPTRFHDPARFAFAHGGKDGHPFPVPLKIYDQSIQFMETALQKAKLGYNDKQKALKKLHTIAKQMEKDFTPNKHFDELVQHERNNTYKYDGRTVFGKARKPESNDRQLCLFN